MSRLTLTQAIAFCESAGYVTKFEESPDLELYDDEYHVYQDEKRMNVVLQVDRQWLVAICRYDFDERGRISAMYDYQGYRLTEDNLKHVLDNSIDWPEEIVSRAETEQ